MIKPAKKVAKKEEEVAVEASVKEEVGNDSNRSVQKEEIKEIKKEEKAPAKKAPAKKPAAKKTPAKK